MKHIYNIMSSLPILIPKIKPVNLPMLPSTYLKAWKQNYMYEKLIKLKYHGETFYEDEYDDSNNVYSDDWFLPMHSDISSYFNEIGNDHLEDDEFTLTTFNCHMKNDTIN